MNKTYSAGGVVLNKKGEVLVVSQKGKSWSLPKGHVEAGEDYLTAARREIEEESGISELTLIKNLGFYERHKMDLDNNDDMAEMKQMHLYLFTTTQELLQPKDNDNPEARWVEKGEVARLLTHLKDKEFFMGILAEIGN